MVATKSSKRKHSARKSAGKGPFSPRWRVAPLKSSFMLAAMLGFLISAYMVSNPSYKIAFMLIFAAMFVASLISMTKAPVAEV